jgi:hypothetical protein
MNNFNKFSIISALLAVIFTLAITRPENVFAATSPTLGTVGSYSILGNTTVTNTGGTTMPGDLGISIGGAPTGFPPGTVGPPGTVRNAGDSLAAQNANTSAFGSIDQGCDTTYSGVKDLVGLNLVAGVYCAGAFELSGTLTLSGTGVWIFKSASTLITSGAANVVGSDPCNVWWRVVSSATISTNTSFMGSILASTSISLQTGASLNGRALAQTGAVTLDSNTITGATCLSASITTPPTTTNTPPSTNTISSSTSTSIGVPKLPNTGYGPDGTTSTPWVYIFATTVLVALSSRYVVRKLRII